MGSASPACLPQPTSSHLRIRQELRSCPGTHCCTDGCRRSRALLAGRRAFGGRGGGGESPAARQVLLSPEAWVQPEDSLASPTKVPLNPTSLLPSLSLSHSHLPRSSFGACRVCPGCAWTGAGWTLPLPHDASTVPRAVDTGDRLKESCQFRAHILCSGRIGSPLCRIVQSHSGP